MTVWVTLQLVQKDSSQRLGLSRLQLNEDGTYRRRGTKFEISSISNRIYIYIYIYI